MHNLAIALHDKGYRVTGSDDEIFEPSKTRLENKGLLPFHMGWNAEFIQPDLDAVIVGMHARKDNPELLRAQELNLKIYSYPEYLYEQTKEKTRIVIGGSHGKTTITSMILHVMNHVGMDADYMVGAQLKGFDCMVKLTSEAKVAVLEGDEYLSSPTDLRPKFHLYHPNIALLSGIAWDHINVFPTFENYVHQFDLFVNLIRPKGHLFYASGDSALEEVAQRSGTDIHKEAYPIHPHRIENGVSILNTPEGEVKLEIFGDHNLQNLNGARLVCEAVGIAQRDFYAAMSTFTGASKRLEVVKKDKAFTVFKDFAHSPSKLRATTQAVKNQFGSRPLTACLELHTFSSLNADFLLHYAHCMDLPDQALVYFNPHTIEHKRLEPITAQQVKAAFQREDLVVMTDALEVKEWVLKQDWKDRNLLWMTSGNFDGQDITQWVDQLGMP